jgi:succinyl-diaminopimelate desuccinylase
MMKEMTVKGVPGHASMPEAAENAVSKAMALLRSMLAGHETRHPFVDFYNDTIGLRTDGSLLGISCRDKDSGSLTCSVGLLDLTPESVSMTLDIRYPVTSDADSICAQIRRKCSQEGLEIVSLRDIPPLYIDKDSIFVQTLLSVYNAVMHTDVQPIAMGGGTYARSMPNVVAFGPNFTEEGDVAHQAGEYIRLEDLFLCREIYEKAISALVEFAAKK